MEAQAMEQNSEASMRLVIEDKEHAEIIIHTPNKSANILSKSAMLELHDHLAILKTRSEIKTLLIYSNKPGMFLAGADINEIKAMNTREEAFSIVQQGQDLLSELEDLPQVTMVAIDGPCMGGGLELSLACDYRVCSDNPKTRLALPEVQLGILPGLGGTQRLPRTIDLVSAITMITSGAPFDARKAKRAGLVDDVMPVERMIEICRKTLREGSYKKYGHKLSAMQKVMGLPGVRKLVFNKARKQIIEKTKGHYPAPLKALEVVERTYGGELRPGLLIEANGFVDLAVTPVSKNLIGIFFSTEEQKKERGIADHEAPNFKPKKVQHLGVLGAGIMGGGISAVAAKKGVPVRLKDISHESINTALKTAHKIFNKDLARKRTNKAEYLHRVYGISPTLKWTGFEHLDFIIEAVIEKMEIKKDVLAELEQKIPADTIIATNTSSLVVGEMATALQRPERFVGMHFFNPVPLMPLVEVVRAEKTSPETVAQTVAFAKQLGKTVIVVKDKPGFLINRILMPFLIECGHLKQDGYSVKQIDDAAVKFGMPMGPFRLLDEIGLDTAAKVADVIASAYPHMKVLPLIHDMVKKGNLGKKNGKGFYLYDAKGKETGLRSEFKTNPQDPGEATDFGIQDRLILPMLTEAVMSLDEGVVRSVRDVDIGLIFGIGFPPFRGGLLRWVSSEGEAEVLERFQVIHNATKGRLVIPEGLKARVQNNEKFYPELGA